MTVALYVPEYEPATAVPETVSVPPTVKLAVPAVPKVAAEADGDVVKLMLALPDVTVPPVVTIEKDRPPSPATVKASAELVEPGTRPTSPPTLAAPAALTVTDPPVPVVNLPKLSAAPEVCVSTTGDTTTAVADPFAVEVLPDAANAVPGSAAATTAAKRIFFMFCPTRFATNPRW